MPIIVDFIYDVFLVLQSTKKIHATQINLLKPIRVFKKKIIAQE